MTPTITAFETAPDQGRGLVRDLRVRWALEEVGQPYDVRLLSFAALKAPAYLGLQPFGQIPCYEEGDLVLFESGAIVLHLAERHGALLPGDARGRGLAMSWLFAALNTVEPPLVARGMFRLLERDKPWYAERLPQLDEAARKPLTSLSRRLGEAEWLEGGAFTVGDLMMAAVLFRSKTLSVLGEYPNLLAYVARAEARPAFQRAFTAQRAVFEASQAALNR